MKHIFPFLLFILINTAGNAQENRIVAEINNSTKYKLVGELGLELGDTVTIRGVIVEGPYKGREGGPNILVQAIRDSLIQTKMQIPISPYFGEFGSNTGTYPHPLPKLENGATYIFKVYETGEFTGRPSDAYNEAKITLQTSGFYFLNRLIVISGKKTDPIEWTPADFVNRKALLTGIAKNQGDTAIIETPKWKVSLIGLPKWAKDELGNLAEVYGTIRETNSNSSYRAENGWARLANLKDQLGKTVILRGIAWSMNGYWWFNYRGTEMYVEKIDELPGWESSENHGRSIEITGILEQEKLPRLDQITLKPDRDLKMYYIIRKASWRPVSELLTPEIEGQ